MKRSIRKWLLINLVIGVFSLTGATLNPAWASDLLPAGVMVKEAYRPGVGASVGEISQVEGKAAVIHINDPEGYWAKAGDKLFKGDTVITLADAHVAFMLEDGSFMTLSAETKLEITKSIYAPEKKSRSTFMNLIVGKTRFVVKKLVDARHSEFKVKTTTSVAGVRGSDFVIAVMETVSDVTALEHTELEVISLAAPDVKPTILHDFERTTVHKGAPPAEARKVTAEEVDRLMKEFKFQPSDTSPEGFMEPGKDQAGEDKQPTDQLETMVLREKDLIKPDFRYSPDMLSRLSQEERLEFKRLIKEEQMVEGTKTNISHQQYEDIAKSKLPDFPGTP